MIELIAFRCVVVFASVIAFEVACIAAENVPETAVDGTDVVIKAYEDQLEAIKERTGAAPSVSDLLQILEPVKNDKTVTLAVWRVFKDMQKPMIEIRDLKILIESKISAISDLSTKSQFREFEFDTDQEERLVRNEQHEVVFSDSKRFLKIVSFESSQDGWSVDSTVGYDGDLVRTFTKTKQGGVNAGVSDYSGRSQFERPTGDLLWLSMLYDSRREAPNELPFYDLVAFCNLDVAALEELKMIQGQKCMVVSLVDLEVYLDINKDFSVVRFVKYKTDKHGKRFEMIQRDCLDLVDYGNGLWFPRKCTEMRFSENGQPSRRYDVAWSSTEVNKPKDISFFRDIIPPGTIVADIKNNQAYYSGKSGSIGEIVDAYAVTPKSTPTAPKSRLFLITANIVVMVTLVVWIVLRQLRQAKKVL